MGLVYVLFVSIPEETLLLILTLLAIGKREYLDLKNKSNVMKMLSSITFTTLFAVLLHDYVKQSEFMLMVQVLFFIIVYWLMYKMRFLKALSGFLIALIIFILGEYFGTKIVELTAGITRTMLEQQYGNSGFYAVLLIPRRVLQIIVAIILYRTNGFRSYKATKNKSFNGYHT